jgi:hypothetical protein
MSQNLTVSECEFRAERDECAGVWISSPGFSRQRVHEVAIIANGCSLFNYIQKYVLERRPQHTIELWHFLRYRAPRGRSKEVC